MEILFKLVNCNNMKLNNNTLLPQVQQLQFKLHKKPEQMKMVMKLLCLLMMREKFFINKNIDKMKMVKLFQ